VLTFLPLLPSNRQLNRLILVSFYSSMTTEPVLAELLCCDCVFCNSLINDDDDYMDRSQKYVVAWQLVNSDV